MKSAGNDIVALDAINTQRTNDSRFYSKFVTPAELALHNSALSFEIFVWLLWSVKEAAYKYLQRHDAGLIFSPEKFTVQQIIIPGDFALTPFTGIYCDSVNSTENLIAGTVSFGTRQLYFRSKLKQQFIMSIVDADEQFENVYWGIQLIENNDHQHQSKEVRDFASIQLQSVLGLSDLQIAKSEIGYPVVLDGGTPLDVALSFAHHDRFVGYSFKL